MQMADCTLLKVHADSVIYSKDGMMKKKYVLISAAKNEAAYIHLTIESVLGQKVLPEIWVIVNDGSTDETETIIKNYQQKSDIIHLISKPPNTKRHFAAKVLALKTAMEYLSNCDISHEFLGNLDADVSFGTDFYEKLLLKMEENPNLGIAGGLCHEMKDGKWVLAHTNPEWSIGGATHFFRAEFFWRVGGYPALKYGGEDAVVEYLARGEGYTVTAQNGVVFHHHKGRTFDNAALKTYFKRGKQEYMCGFSPLYEVVRCGSKILQKPIVLHGVVRMFGFIFARVVNGHPSIAREYVKSIRKQQLRRLGETFKIVRT